MEPVNIQTAPFKGAVSLSVKSFTRQGFLLKNTCILPVVCDIIYSELL